MVERERAGFDRLDGLDVCMAYSAVYIHRNPFHRPRRDIRAPGSSPNKVPQTDPASWYCSSCRATRRVSRTDASAGRKKREAYLGKIRDPINLMYVLSGLGSATAFDAKPKDKVIGSSLHAIGLADSGTNPQ